MNVCFLLYEIRKKNYLGPWEGGVHDSTMASSIALDTIIEENCKIDGKNGCYWSLKLIWIFCQCMTCVNLFLNFLCRSLFLGEQCVVYFDMGFALGQSMITPARRSAAFTEDQAEWNRSIIVLDHILFYSVLGYVLCVYVCRACNASF